MVRAGDYHACDKTPFEVTWRTYGKWVILQREI